jgi:hypothetical protein
MRVSTTLVFGSNWKSETRSSNIASRYHTALVPHAHFEEREFSWRKFDWLAGSLGGAPDQIKFKSETRRTVLSA